MPALTDKVFVTHDGCRIAYSHHLQAGKSQATLVFSCSLGTTQTMWANQVASLREHFNIVTYDMRGHGRSDVPLGSYSIDRLGTDVIELLDHLKLESVVFCGLSIGGMIGQWLAARVPERLEKLILANTSAYIGPPSNWQTRIETTQKIGLEGLWLGVVERWFSSAFIAAEPEVIESMRTDFISHQIDGYIGCCAAIRDADLRTLKVPESEVPTLIIAGTHDLATPPAQSYALAETYIGSCVHELNAGHISNMECADEFNSLLLGFYRTN